MASTSSYTPLHIIDDDDDDEFDWEAAVKEIDNVACESKAAATSSDHFSKIENENKIKTIEKRNFIGRQSTLDKFIGIASNSIDNLRNKNGFTTTVNSNDYNEGEFSEERVSSIKLDAEAAKTWIYPVNAEMRDYQFNITKTALFSNTLVVLPTGLGKTLIAAVVMYNYFRWFPEGKIVFAAPSRPLVMQQIEACHNIVGIPQEWTIDLTGQTNPTKRAVLWKDKRVFFVTPQVLEKDINSGSCLVRYLVCLVIDEAHRATGNYAYCVAVRQLMSAAVQLRILALSATPGSKQQTIQDVIDNLQISTLEYRSETDHDVAPYVHDRKIELVQVSMGKDADQINDLLLEVIRPSVGRLCAIGVLQSRDVLTLSPCDLLNSRERFRQAPPEHLPQMKYGEVEGYFGVLITLYHLRKLLSSHGIKPAFEMLEEKLHQGSFARLMSRNEVLLRAKLLMQQNVTHGAPSPKLSKMLEILVNHFKNSDPQNSRVIIFSNFRGSVRDIMNSLANIGEFVKATEFIGQSSAKALKGQSQKVQQAVLEKFRSGKYNVIVATSIGEEGLDIMEVDLVICFDANVSPLRMIQRMGRTGRKHEGKVVVLACEGSELKGYLRKKSRGKAIQKHMRSGGSNSFNFHSSPRMIPHVFKPEVQFVELSIEQFVHRGKKVRDDQPVETPTCIANLTDSETKLIAKYFSLTEEKTWRPSLIAFPLFQSYPSRVHSVMHSSRTGMLIDTMQYLQEPSHVMNSKDFLSEVEASSDPRITADAVAPNDECMKGSPRFCKPSEVGLECEASDIYINPKDIQLHKKYQGKYPPVHKFLFGSESVSVDDLGMVQILTVPQPPLEEVSCPKFDGTKKLINHLKKVSTHLGDSGLGSNLNIEQLKSVTSTSMRSMEIEKSLASGLDNPDEHQEEFLTRFGRILHTPSPKGKSKDLHDNAESPVAEKRTPVLSAEESNNDFNGVELSPRLTNIIKSGYVRILHTPSPKGKSKDLHDNAESPVAEKRTPVLSAEESNNDFNGVELSPRLTNFIKSGYVPESPTNEVETLKRVEGSNSRGLDLVSQKLHNLVDKSSQHDEKAVHYTYASGKGIPVVSINEIGTPPLDVNKNASQACNSSFSLPDEAQTPLVKVSNLSSSKDWQLSSGDQFESVEQKRKFKRLRKYGDFHKNARGNGEHIQTSRNIQAAANHGRGAKRRGKDAAVFIEEEAELSTGVTVSDDEEDEKGSDSYDGSFIDDRINPTAASTQAEGSRVDMIALYRRSLLSQSPMARVPNFSTDFSPESVARRTRTNESASTSGREDPFLHSPQAEPSCTVRNSVSRDRPSICTMSKTILNSPNQIESNVENRKRKLSFNEEGSLPVHNLEKEFLAVSETPPRKSPLKMRVEQNDEHEDMFDDDQFYQSIDLDAVEEEAAKRLRYKSECALLNNVTTSEAMCPNLGVMGSPTFDLGI